MRDRGNRRLVSKQIPRDTHVHLFSSPLGTQFPEEPEICRRLWGCRPRCAPRSRLGQARPDGSARLWPSSAFPAFRQALAALGLDGFDVERIGIAAIQLIETGI